MNLHPHSYHPLQVRIPGYGRPAGLFNSPKQRCDALPLSTKTRFVIAIYCTFRCFHNLKSASHLRIEQPWVGQAGERQRLKPNATGPLQGSQEKPLATEYHGLEIARFPTLTTLSRKSAFGLEPSPILVSKPMPSSIYIIIPASAIMVSPGSRQADCTLVRRAGQARLPCPHSASVVFQAAWMRFCQARTAITSSWRSKQSAGASPCGH